MTTILLVGPSDPVLEGLAQLLARADYTPAVTHSAHEAAEHAMLVPTLVAVVRRDIATADAQVLRLPLLHPGATILYRTERMPVTPLPHTLARMVLAELALPLERQRLLALIQRLDERARETGRMPPEPPEQRL
jgi:DNA-binding NtrC family response regulator